ncbi:hypothetical protein CKM354_000850800 [Cercospora kikuchii]|uniref:Uncharacterized protein n=1 Tax=Cercospora kikuchii TaxID=84275 RepID=A0A9P3CRL0_9PEZI|nr:uncharacterized protein CKM354_000850800 [Cercospora kikuchii]GIZ45335.1 hypothetical protein CKM354_000850800 [Cercospora kikuchii]
MDFLQQRPRAGSSAQSQPAHRRPSWAQSPKSYEIYMRKNLAADRVSQADDGAENYSYDDTHLGEWAIPKELEDRLPSELKAAVKEWRYAGAAVCTALVRIEKLDDESLYRGYPEHTLDHLSRRPSIQSSAVVGAETPPMSSPVSPTPIALPASLLRLEKLEQMSYRPTAGIESPPFSPVDTPGCPTPDTPSDYAQSATSNARAIAHRFPTYAESAASSGASKSDSFSSSFGSYVSTAPSTPAIVSFDEAAWETFLKTYSAELYDINTNSGPRLKGAGYTVDRLRVELGMEKGNEELLTDFNEWWSGMKAKVTEYDEKIRELEMPNLETVRAERLANGMPV